MEEGYRFLVPGVRFGEELVIKALRQSETFKNRFAFYGYFCSSLILISLSPVTCYQSPSQ